MSEMIERVARALYEGNPESDDPLGQQWDAYDGFWKDYWRTVARIAIEKMREPTEEMIDAGWNATDEVIHEPEQIKDIWDDMIDAALASGIEAEGRDAKRLGAKPESPSDAHMD